METKTCTECGVEKPLTNGYWYKDGKRQDGVFPRCKGCKAKYDQERYERTKDVAKERMRKNRLAQFGLTPEEYSILLENQGNGCAICGASAGWQGKRLAVDHNHTSGAVRGLLCDRCNTVLGKMEDSPELLRKAATYLG
jgi:hypothetical protein